MKNIYNFGNIRNIIFDLGGVILNIDYNLTANEFKNLGISNYSELYTQFNQISIFDNLEMGKISPKYFYNSIKTLAKPNITDLQIRNAWNAMLLDFPLERLVLLEKLKSNFNIFLCSNTNKIHLNHYNQTLKNTFGLNNLSSIFVKEYYSHIVGLRKPNVEIFNLILNENSLNAKETLFIDDSPQHIEGAKKAGLITYHLTKDTNIVNFFAKYF